MNSKSLFVLIAFAAVVFAVCPAEAGPDSSITITSSGDGSYYMGEEIQFSGTNSESDYTYLFITGPRLDNNGCKLTDIQVPAVTGREETFARAKVASGGTWKYALDTNTIGLHPQTDAGTYTIYAVTEPDNKEDLSRDTYETVSIVIKRPFITAVVSEPEIKRGEELAVTGTAEGCPHSIGIWVFGKNYWNGAGTGSMVTVVPEDDASYRYVLDADETAKMEDGEYFVIVQHSMYDDELDIITQPNGDRIMAVEREPSGDDSFSGFVVWGSSALKGADAAEELIKGINLPYVDDTYAKCTFEVEGQVEKKVQSRTEQPTQNAGLSVEEQSQNEEKPEGGQSGGDTGFFAAIGNFFAGLFG